MWDLSGSSPTLLHVLHGHERGVHFLVFRDDDRHLVSASWDETLVMWDWREGERYFMQQLIDGDSASSTELYALLSALADVPLRQDLAVTGSVNQFGVVQPVGGINEKIEGFFDICVARGLTGRQGVLIPAENVCHLMLREDVVAAAAAGQFAVWAVRTVDEAMELLTGLSFNTIFMGATTAMLRMAKDTVHMLLELLGHQIRSIQALHPM